MDSDIFGMNEYYSFDAKPSKPSNLSTPQTSDHFDLDHFNETTSKMAAYKNTLQSLTVCNRFDAVSEPHRFLNDLMNNIREIRKNENKFQEIMDAMDEPLEAQKNIHDELKVFDLSDLGIDIDNIQNVEYVLSDDEDLDNFVFWE